MTPMNPFVEALERAERVIAEKNAENERLRSALLSIAEYPHNDIAPQTYLRVTEAMRFYARSALRQP